MRIGVFDSGIGGEAIATELRRAFPQHEILTANDRAHVPYGNRSQAEVIELTDDGIQPLIGQGCNLIVIACNTATALAIEELRTRYPDKKFVGIEPMLKTAARLTKTMAITVCATPATLSSRRYRVNKIEQTAFLKVFEPDCSQWAGLIEQNAMTTELIDAMVDESQRFGSDVIVLGCTHYHWIKDEIVRRAGPSVTILEPSQAIAARVQSLINF